MQVKLLKDLVEELAGMSSGQIVGILYDKKDVNEFLIAKKMEMTINQVRNILYKLSADGLVSFTRKKDKRKGWYIYYWTLNTEKCLVKLEETLLKKIQELHQQLKSRETKRFYICKPCNIEVSEENALEHGFSCEECAGVYELAESESHIKEINNKRIRLERELKVIREELLTLRSSKEKKREKKEKKEEKNKAKEKAEKRAKNKLIKKNAEKIKKKPAKKSKIKKKKK